MGVLERILKREDTETLRLREGGVVKSEKI